MLQAKSMKRIFCFLISLILMILLCGCNKTVEGHDSLIEKAKEEIPLSNIENMEIMIAGSVDVGKDSLVWFVTGNEYQKH